MKESEYMAKRKELVTGQGRARSRMYPIIMGVFIVLILANVAMLAFNNMA